LSAAVGMASAAARQQVTADITKKWAPSKRDAFRDEIVRAIREDKLAKTPSNHGKPWTKEQVEELKNLAKQSTPTKVIAIKLERTPDSIVNKAIEQRISLKPTSQTLTASKSDSSARRTKEGEI